MQLSDNRANPCVDLMHTCVRKHWISTTNLIVKCMLHLQYANLTHVNILLVFSSLLSYPALLH